MPIRLMCITAHPDDECAAFGGALALAAERGVETFVLCLTDGQAATFRGTASTPAELGQLRRKELADACAVLGVTRHEVLDYQDGQLDHCNFLEVAGLLVSRIRSWRPNVVLTFGGDGGLNTHRDHTMVSTFATAAFHWAGRTNRFPEQLQSPSESAPQNATPQTIQQAAPQDPGPQKLQPHTAQKLYCLSYNFLLTEGQPLCPPPYSAVLDVRSVQAKRMEAFLKHTTQLPAMDRINGIFQRFRDVVLDRVYHTQVRRTQRSRRTAASFAGMRTIA